MKKFLFLFLFLFLLIPQIAMAGDLVANGGEVTSVTTLHDDSISLTVSGGTNNICEGQTIKFDVDHMTAAEDALAALQRAYSTALTALTTGMTVRIHSYIGDNCREAQFIKLSK